MHGIAQVLRIAQVALLFAAALVCQPACADLFTADLAYSKGDYERAFKDYRELAELGQPTAQFNIAVMYSKGQGTRQSELNAYAWALLAEENGIERAKSLLETLRPVLAPGSEKLAEDIRAQFGRAALDKRLMPDIEDDTRADALEKKRCRPTKVFMPDYPMDYERTGVQGSVYIEFTEMPDGTSRNPRVVYSIPKGLFAAGARQSVLRTKFGVGGPDDKPVQCTLFYEFAVQGLKSDAYKGLDQQVRKTLQEAQSGDVRAEMLYGYMVVGLPQLQRPRSEAMPWFLKAAQAGQPTAQYQVGYNLLKGWGCRCDDNKGLEWLRKAAAADEPQAQVTLAMYALRGTPDPENLKRAKLWLEHAAGQNSREGKLYLAAVLAAAPAGDLRDPKRALTLVDEVFKSVDDDPTAFEIRAAAQASAGVFAEAVNSERKAISMAHRLKWDLTPMNERLARYTANQPWYGDLLVF